jgi:ribosomal protein L16 Arg81 hydroxylase
MTKPAATLEALVAPLAKQDFLSLLRQRKLTYLRGSDPNRFRPLLDWESLLERIERGEYPRGLADFRIVKESVNIRAEQWLTKNKGDKTTRVDIAKVEQFLAEGYSLVVTPIQSHVPSLSTLCENIAAHLSEQIKVGVVVTTGSGGAFKLHYDPEDLIILQVEGTKRWRIYGPAVPNPVIGMPKPPPPAESAPLFDEVLQPGDMLFLPAGNWHHCENGPGRSLHLGIFCIPPTCLQVVRTLFAQLVYDETFRIPLTRFEDGSELARLEDAAKDRLIEKVRQLKLDQFLSEAGTQEVPNAEDT